MDTSILFNFLRNNTDVSVPFPWERVLDIQKELVYYRHCESGFVIFDFRPLIDFGEGICLENSTGCSFIDQEVIHQLISDNQGSKGLFLFRTSCTDKTFYAIVEQSIARCPLCKCLISWFP
ncbi:uncharacterized protein LOC114915005 [Cajanus cajan]|uniref:uncharacterized protein LOC114915005 n=1 Tax=Cajanus cajan TaxID=3821 RepID=UPI0010FB5376|nr:uncharacterized protein LOC114915005 [Cajanus cajan]